MIIEYQNNAQPLPLDQFLVGITLSSEDKKTVAATCEKLRRLEKLRAPYSGIGAYGNADDGSNAVGRARQALAADPSPANVAALEAAFVKASVFEPMRNALHDDLNAVRDREIASLGPITAAVIDRIAANVTKAGAEHKRALSKSPLASTPDDALTARLEKTHAELAAMRGRVLRELAALDFLCRVGLAQDPVEAAEVEALDLDDDADPAETAVREPI